MGIFVEEWGRTKVEMNSRKSLCVSARCDGSGAIMAGVEAEHRQSKSEVVLGDSVSR